jgi:hypothetical protein
MATGASSSSPGRFASDRAWALPDWPQGVTATQPPLFSLFGKACFKVIKDLASRSKPQASWITCIRLNIMRFRDLALPNLTTIASSNTRDPFLFHL